MKKIDFKGLIAVCIFCLLPILVGVWQYNALPEQMAIHFDINNNPDNYFHKAVFVFGFPLFAVFLEVFCSVIIDLTDKYKDANKKVMTIFKWVFAALLNVMYVITIIYNLGTALDIRVWVMLLVGMMFVVIGNYIPKTVGSTKWPQRNFTENVLKRINRIAGYVTIFYGLLLMLSVFFVPLISFLVFGMYIIFIIALMFYGVALDKKERAKPKEDKKQ